MTTSIRVLTTLVMIGIEVLAFGPFEAHGDWWCGPSGSPLSKWIPDQISIGALKRSRVDFRGACMRHDVCYTIKNNDKTFCDEGFLKEMQDQCHQQLDAQRSGLQDCLAVAKTYYSAVRSSFGDRAYEAAQRRN